MSVSHGSRNAPSAVFPTCANTRPRLLSEAERPTLVAPQQISGCVRVRTLTRCHYSQLRSATSVDRMSLLSQGGNFPLGVYQIPMRNPHGRSIRLITYFRALRYM